MAQFLTERVLSVHHWTDAYFSFTTTRDAGLRFDNGQFVMIGLMVDGRPLVRAYSIASANWEEELAFFSIKVQDGPLTSRLQHLQVGDELLVSAKPTGTLLISDLHPGGTLYLVGTGTGLAPWLSILKDPDTWERFEHVVVVHGVRHAADLAYREWLTHGLRAHEILGELVGDKLRYVPVVSREDLTAEGILHGRVTTALDDGRVAAAAGLPPLSPEHDRVMICGSPQMLADTRDLLDRRGFEVSMRIGQPGHYVFERAFVEK
jgi:ferredoxin--NADP+ reductase